MKAIASFLLSSVILAMLGVCAAETHTVRLVNRCGFGTPKLIKGSNVLSTGADYVSRGPLTAAIAYMQDPNTHKDRCGFNGDGCTIVETTLVNPDPKRPGSGSSTDISLIPPLKYSVKTGFGYYGGCNGAGASCGGQDCNTAFKQPWDTHVQVACQTNDVNLAITFC
ncbi:glycopeptide [Agrocybe pediades]|nr:glycopeptide [Agrocybe pediades]